MRNRLAALRAKRGWSQAELAARLRISRQSVISIERGRYDPSLPLAFRIAAIFGTRIEDIFSPDSQAEVSLSPPVEEPRRGHRK